MMFARNINFVAAGGGGVARGKSNAARRIDILRAASSFSITTTSAVALSTDERGCRRLPSSSATRTTKTSRPACSTILDPAATFNRHFSSPTIADMAVDKHSHSPFSTATATNTPTIQQPTRGPVTERLFDMIAKGTVQPDEVQLRTAQELDRLYQDLMTQGAPPPFQSTRSDPVASEPSSRPSFFLGGLFGSSSSSSSLPSTTKSDTMAVSLKDLGGKYIKGVYSYGGVGCGKTFLMDLLYDAVGTTGDDDSQGWANDRQKVHFHKFMLNIHQFMHMSRKEQQEEHGDSSRLNLIDPVVDHILQQGRLLCLDEFQVTDVADAMILKEIFSGLWKQGCVLVATSNRPPQDLYKDGLQRDRFLPFIDLLEKRCEVVSLMNSDTDYRMVISSLDVDSKDDTTKGHDTTAGASANPRTKRLPKQVYWFGKGQSKALKKFFSEMTKGRPTNPTSLETQGRKVKIPMACKTQNKSIAMFAFEDLCQKALGAADYLVVGQQFSTVFVYSIPQMNIATLNWLRRFITFVDTMYELKVTLILQTQAPSLQEIFVLEDTKEHYSQDEVFAFDRTLSRLEEMKSTSYLSSKWIGGADTALAGSAAPAPVKKRLILQPSLADSPTSFHEPVSLLTFAGPLGK